MPLCPRGLLITFIKGVIALATPALQDGIYSTRAGPLLVLFTAVPGTENSAWHGAAFADTHARLLDKMSRRQWQATQGCAPALTTIAAIAASIDVDWVTYVPLLISLTQVVT